MKGARPETSKGIVRARDRERRALDLRKAGATYEQIAAKLDITPNGAKKALQRGIARAAVLGAETAEELRRLEVERYDAMLLGIWKQASTGDVQAIDRALRISERRAKLLGLDAAPHHAELIGNGPATYRVERAAFPGVLPPDKDEP